MRTFRDSMCAMKRSDSACCRCSTLIICCFSMTRILLVATAWALPMRMGCPARHPSPKKSPVLSMATTASLPDAESTESLTPPFWMYITALH